MPKILTLENCELMYQEDPQFHRLVDTMMRWYREFDATPAELRAAAMFAAYAVEMRRPANPLVSRVDPERGPTVEDVIDFGRWGEAGAPGARARAAFEEEQEEREEPDATPVSVGPGLEVRAEGLEEEEEPVGDIVEECMSHPGVQLPPESPALPARDAETPESTWAGIEADKDSEPGEMVEVCVPSGQVLVTGPLVIGDAYEPLLDELAALAHAHKLNEPELRALAERFPEQVAQLRRVDQPTVAAFLKACAERAAELDAAEWFALFTESPRGSGDIDGTE